MILTLACAILGYRPLALSQLRDCPAGPGYHYETDGQFREEPKLTFSAWMDCSEIGAP